LTAGMESKTQFKGKGIDTVLYLFWNVQQPLLA